MSQAKCNYHLHTRMCGHATGEPEEYLAAAARHGLCEVGFSDHLPLYFLAPEKVIPNYAMAEEELPVYVEAVKTLQWRPFPVGVKVGIEWDYVPGHEKKLASQLSSYPFDYVLGSVHFMDGWGFDRTDEIPEYGRRDINEIYGRYFSLLQQAALTGLFDIMAHPDLIKKFGFRPNCDLQPLYEETARVFKKAGVCVEVNTAGLRYPAKEIYPSARFLEACFRYGLPVTVGSDAHNPGQVGEGLEDALTLIKSVGYREIAVFKGRERTLVRIR
ncbi:MAG: histidinol-phosphatase HisJ family protein [Firmicutes bacterium]|nr:histidinol-phosphatase HisJ family protein [Bacillota bacterium]